MFAASILLVLVFLVTRTDAFRLTSRIQVARDTTSLQMGFGDMMKKAMANENMGPVKNAGLSKEPEPVEVEFLPSKKRVKALPGQKISMIAQSAGVGIKYDCKRGDCGTCTISFGGKIVKACQTTLPITGSTKSYTITVPSK